MSKIFDEYINKAEENGWIQESDWVKEADYSKSRVGSDTEDAIALLYGVKPNGKDDDKNMTEKAHPDTAVIIPAHDKMNGVVENAQQRQNIIGYVANKVPTGSLTHHRYVAATNDLTQSLVRAAFTLDNQNDERVMTLADSCADRLHKQALAPLAILYWTAGSLASSVGLLAYLNKSEDLKQNVISNGNKAINALQDLKGEAPVENMIQRITEVVSLAQKFKPIQIQVLSTEDAVKAAEMYKDEISFVKEYIKSLSELQGKIPVYLQTLRSVGNSGDLPDWLAKLKAPLNLVFSNDIEEAVNSLGDPNSFKGGTVGAGGLYGAIQDELSSARYVLNYAKNSLEPHFERDIEAKKKEVQEAQQQPNEEPSSDGSEMYNYVKEQLDFGV